MSERTPPSIEDAPGLVWRERKDRWVATWQARTDLVKVGFMPQTVRLWDGIEPTELEANLIAAQCQRLQGEMRLFSQQGGYVVEKETLTLGDLINKYQTDPASRHLKKRYHVRMTHEDCFKRIAVHGKIELKDIRPKHLILWYDEWSANGEHIAMGASMMGHLRTMFGFGAVVLEDEHCERLCVLMKDKHLAVPKGEPREEAITVEQATAIRNKARENGLLSIAIAQALQFDLILRQKDVIGEWVPLSEPGLSDVTSKRIGGKWLRGLRWEEIDQNLILRHATSKSAKGRGKSKKELVVDLKLAPMVMEELAHLRAKNGGVLPTKGPLVIYEGTCAPYEAGIFRRKWRSIARQCGIPDTVYNMDSRAGGITDGEDAGASMTQLRDAATHSNVGTTEGYARRRKKVATAIEVQKIRLAARNKAWSTDD